MSAEKSKGHDYQNLISSVDGDVYGNKIKNQKMLFEATHANLSKSRKRLANRRQTAKQIYKTNESTDMAR